MNGFIGRIVGWLRAGYPDGVPETDYLPLLALLTRRLGNDEVAQIADEVMRRGGDGRAVDTIDIGVLISQITDDLPTPADIERVRALLAVQGWPLDEPRDPGGTP